MTTATAERMTAERRELRQIIEHLSDSSIFQVKGYIERLREEEIEALEDAEDIAYIKTLPPSEREKAVPESEIIVNYEAKYGTLD